MLFDYELAERICREMGMEFHPEQDDVIIGGKKLSNNFSTAELFRGNMTMEKLKPCPFCGGSATLNIKKSNTTTYYVSCTNADCRVHCLTVDLFNKDDVIDIWNHRGNCDS